MNVLLTGSTGNIGRHLKAYLEENGHNVIGISRSETHPNLQYDISDLSCEQITEILTNQKIECIIHLAAVLRPAELGDVLFNSYAITKFFNNEIGKKLKYIVIGSAAEYGLVEDSYLSEESTLPKASSLYGISKLLQTSICEYYANTFGIDIKVVRLFNIITPEMPVTSFWGSIVNAAVKQNQTEVRINNLEIERDFIDVRDFCELIALLLTNQQLQYHTYNAGSGRNTSYQEVIEAANEILKENNLSPLNVTVENKEEKYNTSLCDMSRIKHDLNWSPRFTIKESLKWSFKQNNLI